MHGDDAVVAEPSSTAFDKLESKMMTKDEAVAGKSMKNTTQDNEKEEKNNHGSEYYDASEMNPMLGIGNKYNKNNIPGRLSCYFYNWNFDGVIFRPVIRQDIKELVLLHEILFPVKYSESFYNSLLHKDMLAVVGIDEKTQKIIGVSTARVEDDNESSCYSRREGYISTLGVAPSYRRCGLGRFLLERTVELLENERNVSATRLHVKADNIAAIKMYYKSKFEMAEHLVSHYFFDGKYHDALHLVRVARPVPRQDDDDGTTSRGSRRSGSFSVDSCVMI
mmetsp:Transcript_43280/g.69689  ORF Transcript_43280/g.69689 Transcript_43280/m.69689 type:complete len:279 (+) Transcript_43280:136-972(+)